MMLTIKWVWQQVKGAVEEKAAKGVEAECRLGAEETLEVLEELLEAAKEQRRAEELRGVAARLREEAMLVDAAAGVGEQRARELARRAHAMSAERRTELAQVSFPQ